MAEVIGEKEMINFFKELPFKLDFEFGTTFVKIVGLTPTIGKWQTLSIYLKDAGKRVRLLHKVYIKQMGAFERPMTKKEEQPLEDALSLHAQQLLLGMLPKEEVKPTPAPTPAPTAPAEIKEVIKEVIKPAIVVVEKPYFRFSGKPEVYEKATGRHIGYEEAVRKNIWQQIEELAAPIVAPTAAPSITPTTTPAPAPTAPAKAPAEIELKPTVYENKPLLLAAAEGLPDAVRRIQDMGPATTMTLGEVEPTIRALEAIKKQQKGQLKVEDFATIPQAGFYTNIISPAGPYWQTLGSIQVVARRYNLSAKKLPIAEANKILQTQGLGALNTAQQAYELR